MTAVLLSSACWYLSYQSAWYDRLGMIWDGASCTSVETCLETYLELLKSRYLIFLYSDLMDQFEGSRRFDDHQWNSSATRESSRVIILKSRLNPTGHSACTSEVRDIYDRQTYVPNDRWQLMCLNVLQPWDHRNSMTASVRNITLNKNHMDSLLMNFINISDLELIEWCFTYLWFKVLLSKTNNL